MMHHILQAARHCSQKISICELFVLLSQQTPTWCDAKYMMGE
jgi:hypothetical protein